MGPGEEASLLLSGTAAPLTGLALRARIDPLRADGIALSVTLDPASGEQLAMHRLEWQPSDGLRLGIGEGARYRSDAWRPLYLMGMIPYVLVQRLEVQDRPDSAAALRNNVLVAFDGAWRVVPGLRAYGEGLVDDIDSANGSTRKYGYQLGAEGVTALGDGRLVWGTEYTRLTRYVYTSFFGRSFAAQGRPLGFPTGPDARRIRVRAAWDPSPNWQVLAVVGRVDKGENDLDGVLRGRGRAPDRRRGVPALLARERHRAFGVRRLRLGREPGPRPGGQQPGRDRGARAALDPLKPALAGC